MCIRDSPNTDHGWNLCSDSTDTNYTCCTFTTFAAADSSNLPLASLCHNLLLTFLHSRQFVLIHIKYTICCDFLLIKYSWQCVEKSLKVWLIETLCTSQRRVLLQMQCEFQVAPYETIILPLFACHFSRSVKCMLNFIHFSYLIC